MIRKVLTAIALTATLGGCASYGYREGAGDYYYGSPSVEYDYYGAPYGSTYYGGYGGGLGYGYGGYGGYGYGFGGGYGGYGYGYGGYPFYYGVPYYYYVPRPPRGHWDGNGNGPRPGDGRPPTARNYPGFPRDIRGGIEDRSLRSNNALPAQGIRPGNGSAPRQWAPAERGGNFRSQPSPRQFQRPEAFEGRARPMPQEFRSRQPEMRSSPRPSAAPMRSAPAPSPVSAPRGRDFRRNQD